MLRYTYLGSLCILAALGCGDSVNEATTSTSSSGSGGAGGDDCWYCGDGGGGMAGVGGATTGKGSSGKGGGSGDGIMIVFSGELNTNTGEGTYSGVYTTDDKTVQCDVSYTIMGATLDPSCGACTFAYEMPLSMPIITVATGCNGEDKLTSTKWGHTDPDTAMFEKGGTYTPIKDGGTSKVDADVWTFGLSYYLPGGK
jgi:hypothetical protein